MNPPDSFFPFLLVWLAMAAVAAIIGHGKENAFGSFFLTLAVGPLGVFASAFIDGRPRCSACQEHVGSKATICPHCRSTV